MTEEPDDPERETDTRADEAALELMKQLITLASGVLALSAAFIEKFRTTVPALLVLLAAAWISLIVAVFFGLETISAIVKSRLSPDHDWSTGYGKVAAKLSKYCFVGGLAAFATFAFVAFVTTPATYGDERSKAVARSVTTAPLTTSGEVKAKTQERSKQTLPTRTAT